MSHRLGRWCHRSRGCGCFDKNPMAKQASEAWPQGCDARAPTAALRTACLRLISACPARLPPQVIIKPGGAYCVWADIARQLYPINLRQQVCHQDICLKLLHAQIHGHSIDATAWACARKPTDLAGPLCHREHGATHLCTERQRGDSSRFVTLSHL